MERVLRVADVAHGLTFETGENIINTAAKIPINTLRCFRINGMLTILLDFYVGQHTLLISFGHFLPDPTPFTAMVTYLKYCWSLFG